MLKFLEDFKEKIQKRSLEKKAKKLARERATARQIARLEREAEEERLREEREAEEEDMPEYVNMTAHMVSGKVLKIIAAQYGCDDNDYYFQDDEEQDILRIPYTRIEYLELGETLRKPKNLNYGCTATYPKEALEYSPKQNRLKEVADA